MRKFRLGLVLIVLIVLALWIRSTLPAYASPEEAARQYWIRVSQNAPHKIEEFHTLDQRYLTDGVIVLASYSYNAETGPVQNMSYVIAKAGPFGWYAKAGQSIGMSPLPDLILYAIDLHDDEPLAYGRILSADVSAIEIVFENGETLSDPATSGGFAIIFPRMWQFAELRVLGHEGEILDRYIQLSSLD